MANELKILFLEEGEFETTEQFISDAKEIADWVKKVLNDSPSTKLFTFKDKDREESKLLKVVKENVPEVCIISVDEKEIVDSQPKYITNIICAVLCNGGAIMGTPVGTGTQVPSNYFSLYARARKLAEYVNDL